MSQKIVVIGASAAGLRAAARAKRLLPDSTVVVLDREQVISYGACGLPYFVGGDIENILPLRATPWGVLRDPDFFEFVKDLDVRIGQEVKSIDRSAHQVTYVDLASGQEQSIDYDKLVLATGASSKLLPGIGPDHPKVSVFKTVEDAKHWRGALERNEIDSIAIVGAGFIGLELVEAFKGMWGCKVDLIEGFDQVLAQTLDPEMAALVQKHLEDQGVRLHLGCLCESFEDAGDKLIIHTSKGPIETEHAICAVGFSPNSKLAEQAGLELGPAGGIKVDEKLLTSDPDIYAAGDCIEVIHRVSGRSAYIPLGSLANRQGRMVGNLLAGRSGSFGPVVGSGAVKVFAYNCSSTGLSQAAAKRAGIEVEAVWGTFSDKAHYHPDDKIIFCKLTYRPGDGRLLGFQAVGPGEVVKRVDVLGNLLHHQGTIDDLLDLEFAYAPPFAPAIDPLYVLGCAAGNQLNDRITSVAPVLSGQDYTLLDVRTPGEAAARPVAENALVIPLEEIRDRLDEIPQDKPVLLVCARGARSAEALRILLQAGHAGSVYIGGGVAMLS